MSRRPQAAGGPGRRAGRRAGRRTGLLVLALLVVPTVELLVVLAVGRAIGGWPTFGLLLLESALGAWLVRREGTRAWAALVQALRTGRMPAGELSDAALVLVGGTLLLAPGFLTDLVGFCFVLPVTRPVARRLLARAVERRLLRAGGLAAGWAPAGAARPVVPGEVVDDDHDGRDGQDDGPRHDGAGRTR